MKSAVVAAALAAALAAPALAQEVQSAAAAADTAAAQAVATALSVEATPIETLVANEKAKEVLEKQLPGITSHEAYPQFKEMTLSQLAPMSGGVIDEAKLKAIQEDLDKVK